MNYKHTNKTLNIIWVFIVTALLIAFAVAEPWSTMFFAWSNKIGTPAWLTEYFGVALVMVLRALIIVEAIGYFYHRFVEHLGLLTRVSKLIRKNQRNHWIHHMVYYPIGLHYRKKKKYKRSQKGIPWEWVFPVAIGVVLVIYVNGLNYGSVILISVSIIYALLVGKTHARFHEVGNPWEKNKYFNWLEDVHKLHHWDQAVNFSIVLPFTDVIFGTYMSPKKHRKELKETLEDRAVYDSDIINWHYMIRFAKYPKRAVYISALKAYPDEIKKIRNIANYVKNDKDENKFYNQIEKILQIVNSQI